MLSTQETNATAFKLIIHDVSFTEEHRRQTRCVNDAWGKEGVTPPHICISFIKKKNLIYDDTPLDFETRSPFLSFPPLSPPNPAYPPPVLCLCARCLPANPLLVGWLKIITAILLWLSQLGLCGSTYRRRTRRAGARARGMSCWKCLSKKIPFAAGRSVTLRNNNCWWHKKKRAEETSINVTVI